MFLRRLQRAIPACGGLETVTRRGQQLQPLANLARERKIERIALRCFVLRVHVLHAAAKLRIVGLPDDCAARDGRQVDTVPAQLDLDRQFVRRHVDAMRGVHSAALLVLIGMPFVEHDTIPRLENRGVVRGVDGDDQAVRRDRRHGADTNAPALGKPSLHKLLMIQSRQKARGEAARETLLQVEFPLAGEFKGAVLIGGIERRAIRLRRRGDILGALESPLDFHAAHPRADQLVDQVIRGEVLRAEQIGDVAKLASFAIDDQLVGQAAGLGTLTAVGAAAPQGFARQALSAVGDAQCAVHKNLKWHAGLARDGADVVE